MSQKLFLCLTAAFFVLLTACVGSGPRFSGPPAITANPNPAAPLAAVLTFSAPDPVATTIDVSDGEHHWQLDYDTSHDPAQGLPVVGMRAGRKHEIRVTIRDEAGRETIAPETLEFTTPALPPPGEEFPPLEITTSKPDRMEPGYTLFNPRRRKVGRGPEINKFNSSFGMLLAIDNAGEVVWYYRVNSRISDFEKLPNGNLMVMTNDFRIIEIDWLGNTVKQWYAQRRPQGKADGIPVDTLTLHHDATLLPGGNIVTLSSEWKEIDNYYTSETDANAPRKRQKVMGDVIVEFEPATGKIVWEWHAFDYLDPFRIGYETFFPYWPRRGFPGVIDWSHANNILYDASDDSLVVNFRYQAAAMKIDRKTKQIKWIFGEPSGWGGLSAKLFQGEPGIRWPYHQHSPSPTPQGTLLVFDNGNYQARPFHPPQPVSATYSRAVEYKLDEQRRTAREIWASEKMGPDRVAAIAMGDVDWLPETGNVLVAYGALLDQDALDKVTWDVRSRSQYKQWTRLREYQHTTPPEVVFEVVLRDDYPMGWTLFGAERLPRLGP